MDRVAQVLVDEHVVDDSQRGSQGEKNGWDDLMAKMKSLILASFDLRVNQYEEDIKEKELQRNLPGWNFNTFFVLKEGLARGFESVGLTEDALTGYHELAAGLNAILENEGSEGPAEQQTSRFSPYTGELSEIFKQAESSTKNAQSEQVIDLGSCILDTDRKPFRDLILANNISSFEFQCYIFARQVCLLLRLANVAIPKSAFANGSNLDGGSAATSVTTHYIKPTDSNHEDLAILAEVAQRATNFITSVAGTIRKDIRSSIIQPSASQNGNDISSVVIHDEIVGNIVASWMFSSSQCILEATSTDSLSVQLDPLLRQLRLSTSVGADTDGTEAATVISTVHRKDLPNRTCSLPEHTPIVSHSPSQENFPSITSLDAVRLLPHGTFHPGSQDLAAQRGDLLALGRQVLSGLGLRHGNWKDGLTDAFSTINDTENEMQDVNLAGKPQQETRSAESSKRASMRGPTTASTIAGVCNKTLLQALRSKSDYYTIYEVCMPCLVNNL